MMAKIYKNTISPPHIEFSSKNLDTPVIEMELPGGDLGRKCVCESIANLPHRSRAGRLGVHLR